MPIALSHYVFLVTRKQEKSGAEDIEAQSRPA